MKKVCFTVLVIALLGGAGTAGALIEQRYSEIHQGQWARLGSTPIYCQAVAEAGTRTRVFDCDDWGPSHAVGGTYRAFVDQAGVAVDRWGGAGHTAYRIATYRNP
jgi:hypothetical protein